MSKIILNIINRECLIKFRNLEKNKIKLVTVKSHLLFNITCVNNELLPNYTKFIYL